MNFRHSTRPVSDIVARRTAEMRRLARALATLAAIVLAAAASIAPNTASASPPDPGAVVPVMQVVQYESPNTPGTSNGSLPTTGTDMTTMMLSLGFLTLGAGSIVALATRRRDELSVA